MIGLGVGIDYSLFVINRYREAIIHGREPRAAALESVRTSGRAVQFAAATVIIALLGLFVMRINFFNGIAVASALTVFMVMVGALLLLPAVLSLLGTWAFAGRMAWITDGEAVARQRLGGVPHVIGRVFRYIGWVLVLAGDDGRLAVPAVRRRAARLRSCTTRARSRDTATGCRGVRGCWAASR